LCAALCWAAVWSRQALAERTDAPPLQLLCDVQLPFTRQDLAAALALRMPADTAAGHTAEVRAAGDAMVEVSLGERRRAVYLGERRGGAAARWVALAVIDLITQAAAPPLLPHEVAPATRLPPPRIFFLIYPTIGLGVAANPVQATGGLGSSLRLLRGLRWTLDVSYGGSPRARQSEVEVDLQQLSLRSGPAWRLQAVPLELRLSAVVVPYWLRAAAAAGPAQHAGVVVGGEAALFAYLPLLPRLLATVALGVDLFATRAEFLVGGQQVADTARLTAWLGAGLALRSLR
jgi:hypothetical protein